MTNFVLMSRGSFGDINPFLGLAVALRERGHDVKLLLNEHFRKNAEALDLPMVATGTEEIYLEEQAANAIGRAPKEEWPGRLARWYLPELRSAFRWIEANAASDTVLVARSWTLAGRVAQEKFGLPLATVYVSPLEAPPLFLPFGGLARAVPAPRAWYRAFYDRLWSPFVDRWLDPIFGPPFEQACREVGVTPGKGLMTRWLESPDLAIGLWPDWFWPAPPHWPAHMRTTGFIDHDGTRAPLPDHVAAFIERGPFVLVLAGTYRSKGAERLFAASAEACRRCSARAIFLNEFPSQVDVPAGNDVLVERYLPLRALLPHARAVIHHGGIGTAARALATRTRQLVVPHFGDQPALAKRLEKLGVARAVPSQKYDAQTATRALSALLDDRGGGAARACEAASQRPLDGLSATTAALEGLAASSKTRPRTELHPSPGHA